VRHPERSRFLQAGRKISRKVPLRLGPREIRRPAGESAGFAMTPSWNRRFKLSLPEKLSG
jgi:hypothetical protein